MWRNYGDTRSFMILKAVRLLCHIGMIRMNKKRKRSENVKTAAEYEIRGRTLTVKDVMTLRVRSASSTSDGRNKPSAMF